MYTLSGVLYSITELKCISLRTFYIVETNGCKKGHGLSYKSAKTKYSSYKRLAEIRLFVLFILLVKLKQYRISMKGMLVRRLLTSLSLIYEERLNYFFTILTNPEYYFGTNE